MLQIRHLTITHRKDLRTLIEDFSMVLNPGDRAVLIGEEGNGKSTLLKWICDPRLVEPYAEAAGERITQGKTLAYLPQELPREARGLSVYEFLFGAADAPDHRDAARLFAQLGLDDGLLYSAQSMGSLSGGEKVKLQMAALLLRAPDILLLDEPSNDIDIETLEWLERVILEQAKSVLYISHDETLMERTANRVILLEQLRHKSRSRWTLANVPFRQFMAERAAGMEKQEQLAASERREDAKAQEKFRRIQQKVERAQENVSRADPSTGRLLKKKMAAVKAMERRYERERAEQTAFPEQEDAMLLRMDLGQRMPAGKTVLDLTLPELRCADRLLARDISLSLRGPEKLCIIGRNGVGKSTLLRALLDALREREGLLPGYMPQNYDELLPPEQTPLDFLAAHTGREATTLVRTRLGSLRFTAAEAEHPIAALSGGQKAKLLLLQLTLRPTNVLVLDEPTRNLSPLSGPEVRRMLRDYPGAILSVSHDRTYIAEVCTRVLRLTEEGLVPASDYRQIPFMSS